MIRSPWKDTSWPWPTPTEYRLGIRTPRRYLTHNAFLINARDRAMVMGGQEVEPVCMVINATLLARDSADFQNQPWGDFWIGMLTATSTVGGVVGAGAGPVFQSQIFQTFPNGQVGVRLSKSGINQANQWGTAQNPFILRPPYHCTDLASLVERIVNMLASTNTIQCCLWGWRRRTK